MQPTVEAQDGVQTPSYALHESVSKRDILMTKALLANSADPNARDGEGSTPLHIAAMVGFVEAIDLLCAKGAKVNELGCDIDGWEKAPLHYAAENGNVAVIALLVAKYHADINVTGNSVGTPLHCAIANGHIAAVEILVAKGANVNAQYSNSADFADKVTPLHLAAEKGFVAACELLCSTKGVNIEAVDYCDRGSLHMAAANGQVEVIELLLRRGANVNGAVGTQHWGWHDGWSPLHDAAQGGHQEAVGLLCAKGADVNLTNIDGKTALHIAAENDRAGVIKVFLDNGADPMMPWSVAATKHTNNTSRVSALRSLFSADVKVTCSKMTALHAAAASGSTAAIELLLNEGANINAADRDGSTPLALAGLHPHAETLLRARGALLQADAVTVVASSREVADTSSCCSCM